MAFNEKQSFGSGFGDSNTLLKFLADLNPAVYQWVMIFFLFKESIPRLNGSASPASTGFRIERL